MDLDNPLLKRPKTLNPYRLGLGLLLERIKWDLNPSAWVSRSHLATYRDAYSGQKAVIVCNGPSLLKSDLGLLDGVFTFGLNKINLLFERSDFRPACVVAVNKFVIEQNAAFFNETDIPLFLDSYATRHVRSRSGVTFMNTVNHRAFARDVTQGIYQGNTVTFVALQLAFHMGFQQVALIGADHEFAVEGQANKTVTSGDLDRSHFDPAYFAGGVKWQLPDLFESEVSYTMARKMFEACDREIFNATVGGKLEVFSRIELSEFLQRAI